MLWSFDDVMMFCTSVYMSATLLSQNWLIKLFKIFCMELEETKYVKITETIFSEEKRLIWFESSTFLKFHTQRKETFEGNFLKCQALWNISLQYKPHVWENYCSRARYSQKHSLPIKLRDSFKESYSGIIYVLFWFFAKYEEQNKIIQWILSF